MELQLASNIVQSLGGLPDRGKSGADIKPLSFMCLQDIAIGGVSTSRDAVLGHGLLQQNDANKGKCQ